MSVKTSGTEPTKCVMGKPDLSHLTDVHLTQIKAELWRRGGGPSNKIINSFYSGANLNQMIGKAEYEAYADMMVAFYGDAKKANDAIVKLRRERCPINGVTLRNSTTALSKQ